MEKGPELQTLIHEASHYGLDQLVEELESEHWHSQHESGSEEDCESCSSQSVLSESGHLREDGARCGWIKISAAQFLDLINRPLANSQPGLTLNACDLRGLDLYGVDLRRASLHRCNLAGVDLRFAKLDDACLVECCLRDANLTGSYSLLLGSLPSAEFYPYTMQEPRCAEQI